MSATRLTFTLPDAQEAATPPEARGIARDGVRLMVARRGSDELVHTSFEHLATYLEPGDLLVVNASATLPAAVGARGEDGTELVVHLSTWLDDDRWVLEPRRRTDVGTSRWSGPTPPHALTLGKDAFAKLLEPYRASERLWVARLMLPEPVLPWLEAHGSPIRYGYVARPWPLSAYQTVYATEPGSAEMPSAGRPFTERVIAALVARGVGITPIILHTGVASLEADEVPYPERVSVPAVDGVSRQLHARDRVGG